MLVGLTANVYTRYTQARSLSRLHTTKACCREIAILIQIYIISINTNFKLACMLFASSWCHPQCWKQGKDWWLLKHCYHFNPSWYVTNQMWPFYLDYPNDEQKKTRLYEKLRIYDESLSITRLFAHHSQLGFPAHSNTSFFISFKSETSSWKLWTSLRLKLY